MPTMKAAVVRNFGSPLAIEDLPVPQTGPGEVLVKVKALVSVTPICTPPLIGLSSPFHRSFPAMKLPASRGVGVGRF
jgi:Zn-dependent alcohol dehydrogenase